MEKGHRVQWDLGGYGGYQAIMRIMIPEFTMALPNRERMVRQQDISQAVPIHNPIVRILPYGLYCLFLIYFC